jgi:glutamate-1-semialdehyde 2,1-aminomutase
MFGVPLHWMNDWSAACGQRQGARLQDVDGHAYTDFCLGDTGAMFGHSPAPVAAALARQAAQGITAMLPGEDAVWVGEELARRFGLPVWQFALSASDANRFAIRWARALTGRDRCCSSTAAPRGRWTAWWTPAPHPDSLLGQVVDITPPPQRRVQRPGRAGGRPGRPAACLLASRP